MRRAVKNIVLDSLCGGSLKGKVGEKFTEYELHLGQVLAGRKGKILENVYIPKDDGETSEIDVLFITQKGIFVFESKNYSGWIFGDERNRNWAAVLPNQKNQFYNPILQNKTHMKWLRNYLGEDMPLFSIIVFSNRCELKKITVYSDDVIVIKRERTNAAVKEIWNNNPDLLSDEKIEQIYDRLKVLTNVGADIKKTHVKNVNKNYTSSPTVYNNNRGSIINSNSILGSINTNSGSNSMTCPQCGNKLVLRTAKKGNNIGNQFYGCSAFPKCRYTRNI